MRISEKDLTVRVDWIGSFCGLCSVTCTTLIEIDAADGEEEDQDDRDENYNSEGDIAVASASHGCPNMP